MVDVLTKAEGTSQSEAARLFTECLFDDQTDPDLAVFYNELPTAPAYRLHLGKLLKEHWIVQRLIETIDRHSGRINLEDLSVSLLRAKPLRRWTETEARLS